MKYNATVNKKEEAHCQWNKELSRIYWNKKGKGQNSSCICIQEHKGYETNFKGGYLSGAEVGNDWKGTEWNNTIQNTPFYIVLIFELCKHIIYSYYLLPINNLLPVINSNITY